VRAVPLLAVLLLGLAPTWAAAQEPRERSTRPILVTGRVVERGSGVSIPGARVVLEGAGAESASDRQGLFQFLDVRPGTYVLRVEHIGYGPVSDSLELTDPGHVDLDIQLAPTPVELDPLVVAVRYRGDPQIRDFYERRRTGIGAYLTRADFEDGAVSRVTDAFRQVAGIRLVPRTAGGISVGQAVLLRGRCRPAVYVDGTRLTTRGSTIDEILHPNDIEGIEIYRGPEAPLQFSMGDEGCGSVVIWTRRGSGGGNLPFWKGALVAGALAAVGLLLTR
jgi:hypothetical protein